MKSRSTFLLLALCCCAKQQEGSVADTAISLPAPKAGVYPMVYQPACEGEICTGVFEGHACQDVRLRDRPANDAPLTHVLNRGDTVSVVQAIHLLAPGVVIMKAPYVHHSYTDENGNTAPVKDTLRFSAGDTVHLLLYGQVVEYDALWRGEEFTTGTFWGTSSDSMMLGEMREDTSIAVLRRKPRKEEWWRVTRRDGRVGWHRRDRDTTVVIASHFQEQRWGKECPGERP